MPAALAPSCPRCGYDLTGELRRWESACPLDGRCSECGLDFNWADIVSERLRPPAWSFEHARSRWMLRIVSGWRAALHPRPCWQGLRLEHRVRPKRLIVSIVLLLAILWITLGVSSSLASAGAFSRWWGWTVIGGVMTPPQSDPPSIFEIAWSEHKAVLFMPFVGVRPSPLLIWRGPLVGAWAATLLVATAVMPLAFLLLPQTLRRTRVRRAHLLRAMAYTMVGPWVMLLLGTVVVAWRYDQGRGLRAGWLFALVGLVWLAASWRRVTDCYLKLPQHRVTWLAMLTIALLSGAVAGALMLPGEMPYYRWTWRI